MKINHAACWCAQYQSTLVVKVANFLLVLSVPWVWNFILFSPASNYGRAEGSMCYQTPDSVNNSCSGVGNSLYFSANSRISGTQSHCNSPSSASGSGRQWRPYSRGSSNWMERCTQDPWAGILPKQTPGNGERLTTDALKQRQTVLFTS